MTCYTELLNVEMRTRTSTYEHMQYLSGPEIVEPQLQVQLSRMKSQGSRNQQDRQHRIITTRVEETTTGTHKQQMEKCPSSQIKKNRDQLLIKKTYGTNVMVDDYDKMGPEVETSTSPLN